MAEPDTTTAPDPQEQYIQQMLRQLRSGPPQAASGARARTEQPSSFIGLLGSALGGGPSGSVPMSADEADASGNRALLNFGLNLLANSGYRTDRPTIGQLIGGGIGAAQQSLGQSEYLKAARGQAQQDYAAQQQEMQIARIKEALPLLNLQDEIRRAALARKLAGSGPTASNTNIGAAGASAEVPAELMPHYAAASRETGIPVAVLIAKDKRESGFDNSMPNGGIAQILPSTAAAPGFGLKPISQAELADPGQNIRFGARYLKARGDAAGVKDWNNPAEFSKALLAYNGGGDKNYVANVMQYYKPGAKPAAAPEVAGAPPARQSPIPATDASGGTTAEAAPSPGRAQFAGPGAPPDATAPPPSPGAAGNAEAIAAGMVARGADPTTLAPTGRGVTADEVTAAAAGPAAPTAPPGSVPAQTGGLVVPAGVTPPPGVTTTPAPPPVAQAAAPEAQRDQPDIKLGNGGIIRHPGTPADFRARNYQTAPTTEDFNPNLTEAENAGFARRRAKLEMDRKLLDTVPRAQVSAAVKALNDQQSALDVDYLAAVQGKRAKADAKLTEWNQKQDADLRPLYQDAVRSYDTAAQANLAGDIQTRQTGETARVERERKTLERLDKDAVDSRAAASNLDGALAISNNIDKPSVWATIPFGGSTLLPWATKLGLVSQDEAGATQLLQSVISGVTARMRAGMSMGPLSDGDLRFIESMGPNMYENRETRAAVISYLRRSQDQFSRYNVEVGKLMTKPGMNISDALDQAAKNIERDNPIVPLRPANIEAHWKDFSPEAVEDRKKWMRDNNIRPGTMFRRQDNGLEIMYSPVKPSVEVPR